LICRKFYRLIHNHLGPREARTEGRGSRWPKREAMVNQSIRFHDLRHFHATEMYDAGILPKYAAERLGHDENTYNTIYKHLRNNKRSAEDEKVSNLYVMPANTGSGGKKK